MGCEWLFFLGFPFFFFLVVFGRLLEEEEERLRRLFPFPDAPLLLPRFPGLRPRLEVLCSKESESDQEGSLSSLRSPPFTWEEEADVGRFGKLASVKEELEPRPLPGTCS